MTAGLEVPGHFSDDELNRLQTIARARGVSLPSLIRTAVEEAFLRPPVDRRLAAVERLAALALPVADPEQMERESAREFPLD
jgi:hypothetical protein